MMSVRTRFFGFGVLLLVLALIFAGSSLGFAQEAEEVEEMVPSEQPHPAHIHTGTCDAIGEIVIPLANVAPRTGAGAEATPMGATPELATPIAATPITGEAGLVTGAGIQAQVSVTIVEAPLADLLATPHLINVHLSETEIQTFIACGEITGSPDSENSIYIGLRELNDSGYSGVAWLRDNGDGTTYVTIFLAPGLHGADVTAGATPGLATPEAATPMA